MLGPDSHCPGSPSERTVNLTPSETGQTVSDSQGQHLTSPRNRRTAEEIQQMRLGLG